MPHNLVRIPISFSPVHNTVALLDSGAIASLLSADIFHDLPSNIKSTKTSINYPNVAFRSAPGNPIIPSGIFEIIFSIANISTSHIFYSIPSLPGKCIFGIDFLQKFHFVLHTGCDSVRFKINNVSVDIDVSQTTVRQVASVVMSKSPVL